MLHGVCVCLKFKVKNKAASREYSDLCSLPKACQDSCSFHVHENEVGINP